MQTIPSKDLVTFIATRLESIYDPREAMNIGREILRHFYQIDRLQLSMNEPVGFAKSEEEKVLQIIKRLLAKEPLQHIVGSIEFYGLEFKVDTRALIPRPETEELVDWIITNHPEPALKVLDIGTGTGCIPVALAKNLNTPSIAALDISKEALALAHENARLNEINIDFQQLNVLEETLTESYDLIVSNPPYIPEADKRLMSANVLDYEPDLALFVPDQEPLLFYDRIAMLASDSLTFGGTLYFEIHEAYGSAMIDLLTDKGFIHVELKQDLQGKDRMIKAVKP
ncbi:MAG: peptide chain release factor N(5)-glutamine methyltransferase [Roseivirga sp.]|nr:peptide chain release factor N(5)-glutamine methyltransferase [Roseivirga sp.]